MKTRFITIGKSRKGHVSEAVADWLKRLKPYLSFEYEELAVRTGQVSERAAVMRMEADALLKRVEPGDFIVLLDERGQAFTSPGFAAWLQERFNGSRPMVFVAGGAFGVEGRVRDRADTSLSLSKMTLTHQMARLLFLEQVFRAMKILRNERYHY